MGEMITYHEPQQCKTLCASKFTYISSHPVLQQKFEPLSSRIPAAVLLMLPSLEGRGVIAKRKDDARQTRRYSTAGIIKTLPLNFLTCFSKLVVGHI
jgi:hypothetical protein